jgi:hypothetical protein
MRDYLALVVIDCGWGKRSHKHTYDSLFGVVVIIGLHTKKLLHLEVRNQYCSTCSFAERMGKPPVSKIGRRAARPWKPMGHWLNFLRQKICMG